jgi:hypothetical protein
VETAQVLVSTYVAGYTLWEEERSNEIRTQLGVRKVDKQIHRRGKNGWNIDSGCHQKELPDSFYIVTWLSVTVDGAWPRLIIEA